jgi:GxxExxY protein
MKSCVYSFGKEEPIPPECEEVAKRIIGAAIEVHRHLGPGFLESVYERALIHEMNLQGMTVQRQVPVRVMYKDLEIAGQRADLIVDPGVIIELKTVEELDPAHTAQLLNYLRATRLRLGLLINFNSRWLKDGIRRVVN